MPGLSCLRAPISAVRSTLLPMPSNRSAKKSATNSTDFSGRVLSAAIPTIHAACVINRPGTASASPLASATVAGATQANDNGISDWGATAHGPSSGDIAPGPVAALSLHTVPPGSVWQFDGTVRSEYEATLAF